MGFFWAHCVPSLAAGAKRQSAYGGPSTPGNGPATLRVLDLARSAIRVLRANLFSYLQAYSLELLKGKQEYGG